MECQWAVTTYFRGKGIYANKSIKHSFNFRNSFHKEKLLQYEKF